MRETTLHQHLAAAGAVHEDDRGIALPRDFGDAAAEYRALRDASGVFDAGFRAVLQATGPDRVTFLQGMLTNDVASLASGQGCGSLLLTIQGRVLADVRVAIDGERMLLDVDVRVREAFVAALERLIIADDVELAEVDPPVACIGVEGPATGRLVPAAAALKPHAWTMTDVGGVAVRCVRVSEARGDGCLLQLPADRAAAVWDALVAAGARPVGMAALEARRIAVGVPRIGLDMDEHCLSLEVPVDDCISFKKGCYLGQEVVARGTARGQVHRKLMGLRVTGTPPPRGAMLRVGDKDVGTLTSVAQVPGEHLTIALGFVRREHWSEGATLDIADGGHAVVAAWPLA